MAQEGNELGKDAYEGEDTSTALETSDDKSSNTDLATTAETDESGETTGETTEEIRGQIETTRQHMGETIDAIQERLSYANISEQVSEQVNHAVESAKTAVYDATVGKAADLLKDMGNKMSNSNVLSTVTNNPIPFAMIGIGATMLVLKARSSSKTNGQDQSGKGSQKSKRADNGGNSSGIKSLTGNVSEAAGSAYDKVSDSVGAAYEGVSNAAGQMYGKVGNLGSSARDQYSHYMETSPLAVGAVALAVGAVVGLTVPSTRYEGELMGSAREQLMSKAQDTAEGLIESAKESVREAAASAGGGQA